MNLPTTHRSYKNEWSKELECDYSPTTFDTRNKTSYETDKVAGSPFRYTTWSVGVEKAFRKNDCGESFVGCTPYLQTLYLSMECLYPSPSVTGSKCRILRMCITNRSACSKAGETVSKTIWEGSIPFTPVTISFRCGCAISYSM